MKRLLPMVLAVTAFTVVGCNNQKKKTTPPPQPVTETQPQPQPYTPPPDMSQQNAQSEQPPAPEPQNTSSGTTVHHTRAHHAVASARHGKYVVKKGDTMSKIAHAHHVSLKRLEAANPHVDPNKIHVGQTIMIP